MIDGFRGSIIAAVGHNGSERSARNELKHNHFIKWVREDGRRVSGFE